MATFSLAEVADLLNMRRDDVRVAVAEGVSLPKSSKKLRLAAVQIGDELEFDEADVDTFICAFETEEPGRHPPVAVRRELRIEAGFRCAICRQSAPLQYHHMLEWSRLKHHDPKQMLAICGACHDKVGLGQIPLADQREVKLRLVTAAAATGRTGSLLLSAEGPLRFNWDDLRDVITAFHGVLSPGGNGVISQFDFSDVDLATKNRLNRMGEEYFALMRDHHQAYFGRIEEFLRNPINEQIVNLYWEVIEELRTKLAAGRSRFDSFEEILLTFVEEAVNTRLVGTGINRRVLTVLLSFMYFNCDIGRKQ